MAKQCAFTGKTCFDEHGAKVSASKFAGKTPNEYMRAYVCEFCQSWHITHKKKYRW